MITMVKKTLQPLMESNRQDWATPIALFNILHDEFHFTLDPCATSENTKCKKFYTVEDNGLNQDWEGEIVFINPPYSTAKDWIMKAYEDYVTYGVTSVLLIPARVDTRIWHEIIAPYAAQIRFLKGRVKFVGAENSAPFPSAIIVFSTKIYNEKIQFIKL